MKSHKDLDVWQAAKELASAVYEVTRGFPRDEQFGIVSQMRRSAVSVASNIAEGAGRGGTREFQQFLYVAVGSANELDTQMEIASTVGLGERGALEAVQKKLERVTMMLYGLIRSLKAKR